MISCCPISGLSYIRCHTGAYYRSRWDLQILVELHAYPHSWDIHRDDDLFAIFMMIPQWSLSGVAQLGLHFSTLRRHHAFLLGDAPMIYGSDLVIDMDDLDRAFDDGWFELIWFSDLSHFRCHTGVYPSFQLRFVDSPLICMTTLGFEIHIGLMIWFHYVLILRGAFLESFSRIHVSWYIRDSLTELPQARGFLRHHFSRVHVRSFVRPHRVTLELSG